MLLYVHGLGEAGPTSAAEAGPAWADRGFRVVAPALPGWFDSPLLPEEEYRLGALARRALEAAPRPPVLVGFSWGGMIGVHAPPQRLRGLVLLDGGYWDSEKLPEDEEEERYRRARVGIHAEPPTSAWPALAASGLPVLLLSRDDDEPPRPDDFVAAVPQVELHRLPGAEHNILASVAEPAIELVGTWAARR